MDNKTKEVEPITTIQTNQQVPQKKSVALIWFLSFITLGIYTAIWYIKRKPELDNLRTQKKLSRGLTITFLIFLIVSVIYQIISFILKNAVNNILKENLFISNIFLIVVITSIILQLILAFNTRTIINEVWASKRITRKVSWFFTLIFNFLYLQYEINRTINNKEYEKRTGPWVWFILIFLMPLILFGFMWIVIKSIIEKGISNLNVP